jgi:single-strand DNA-binding protein
MNKIILIGNMCRDIEVNHYNDRKVVRNTIAVRRDYKNKNGEYDSDFFNFSVWGVQAEFVEKYAHKGDKIAIVGKLLNNNYERDGQTIYSNDIQVESIELLSPRKENGTTENKQMDDATKAIADKLGDDIVQFLD